MSFESCTDTLHALASRCAPYHVLHVQFSHKFTPRQIEARWLAILYNDQVSQYVAVVHD
jgi:hypothetical protein